MRQSRTLLIVAALLSSGKPVLAWAQEAQKCGLVAGDDGKAKATQACFDMIEAETSPSKKASMLYQLAYALDERGSIAQALPLLDKAIEILPDDARYLQERGYARTNLGQLTEALADLDGAVRLDPHLGLAIGQRALVKYKLRDYNGSLEDYVRIVELEGQKVDYLFGQAASLTQLGRFSEAQAVMKKLEKLPNSEEAMRALVNLTLEKLAERAKARE